MEYIKLGAENRTQYHQVRDESDYSLTYVFCVTVR